MKLVLKQKTCLVQSRFAVYDVTIIQSLFPLCPLLSTKMTGWGSYHSAVV